MSAPNAVAAIVILILLASAPQSHAAAPAVGSHSTGGISLSPREAAPRPASMGLAAAPEVAALQGSPTPSYDEQLGTTFTQDFDTLAYNVTAVAQADADGYGPGYLLNGLTPAGYWYQVGISYHWPNSDGSYSPGFGFSYEVYGSDGKSVYPSKGAGLGSFSGVVNSGDSVLLSLTFAGSTVQMLAQDWNTRSTASAVYSSEGSSSFVGDAFAPIDSHGFFTGLMTEWYHAAPYYGNVGRVAYTNEAVALSSAWMWIDEFESSSAAPPLFNSQTQSPVTIVDDQVYPFAANGATMYISAHRFVTGLSPGSSTLTLTPAATEASSPSFSATYTSAGQPQTAMVLPGVNALEADAGTMITVAIAQSSTSEYWVFNGTSGNEVTFAAGTNATYVYYHLAQETVSYQVAGGGQALPGSSKPELTYQEPPPVASATQAAVTATLVLSTTPVSIFAIVGSNASVSESISGVPGERWVTNTQNETIVAPNSLRNPIQFYQQYDVSISYSIVGGGTPLQTPEFNSVAFGTRAAIQLSSVPATGWFDAGSGFSFTNILNSSTPNERWLNFGSTCGEACPSTSTSAGSIFTSGEQVSAEYVHQYYAYLGVDEASGGAITSVTSLLSRVQGQQQVIHLSNGSDWFDAGSSLNASASPNRGWQFEAWKGLGPGAYSGAGPSIEVTVTGPLSENATFYPGLVITTDAGTNVAFSYGSTTGTVQAGTTKTLYVPPSTNVTLRATPSLFIYSFASLQGAGLAKASKPSSSLVVDSPSAVTGTSSYSYPVLLGAAVVAAIVIILAVSLLVRSRRSRERVYGFSLSYP